MAKEEQLEEGTVAQAPAKAGFPMVMLAIVMFGVVLSVGGNAGVMIFMRPKTATPEAAKPVVVETKVKSTVHLETFVVNLPDPEHHAYLRIGIEIGLNKEPEKKTEKAEKADGASTQPIAEIRDIVIAVVSQTKPDDLATVEGKKKLKEDLVKQLKEALPEIGVQEVYFTEFLMQH